MTEFYFFQRKKGKFLTWQVFICIIKYKNNKEYSITDYKSTVSYSGDTLEPLAIILQGLT